MMTNDHRDIVMSRTYEVKILADGDGSLLTRRKAAKDSLPRIYQRVKKV